MKRCRKCEAPRCSRCMKKVFLRRALAASLLIAAVVTLLGLAACGTVRRTAVSLPMIPGAEYIGTEACAECHQEIARDFATADHSFLVAKGPNALSAGCESCHGPSSLHAQSGGEAKPPFSFSPGRPQLSSDGLLLAVEPARATETVCFQCHLNVRSEFHLPSHHPVLEGKMSCTECHSPHKGSIHAGTALSRLSQNESCLRCHSAQRGPHVFEHEATREGCATCHAAHGSVNAKMLAARDSNLCLKCHFQQLSGGAVVIGGSDHTIRAQQGTCWTAGCHEAVHGSRVSSSLKY